MKKYRAFSLLIFIIIMISACFVGEPWSDLSSDGTATLPPDQIYDSARLFAGSFEFDTLLEVELVLNVTPHESTIGEAGTIITLHNERGNLVYTGKIQSGGSFSTLLQLPAAPEDMTLTLHTDGFEDREVIIRDMVNYSVIERKMSILSDPLKSRAVTLEDSDRDTVPDIFDAFPDDSTRAFSNSVPADGVLTIAYEDLFLKANAGDADYNDFIATYSITEITNAAGQIVEIQGAVEAVAKLAGYNHLFGIMIDKFAGDALLKTDYIDSSGNLQHEDKEIKDQADIVLFKSTKAAVGKTAGFSLIFDIDDYQNSVDTDFDNPQDRTDVDQAPFNPYLYVYNTKKDIHLIGEAALPGSGNPNNVPGKDIFQDADGFPWALLVPVDWRHPDESQRIEVHYPRFTLWRGSLGADHSDWYLHYDDPYVPPVVPSSRPIVFASDRDGDMEIYSLDLGGDFTSFLDDTLIQLTNNGFTDKHPALSADGTKIAFVSDRSGSWAIHTMDADGSNISGVLVTLSGSYDGHPSWGPDDLMIVYDYNYDIYTLNTSTLGVTNLTKTIFADEKEPSWSPDGTKIAYSMKPSGGDYNIYTMDSDGSGASQLTTDAAIDQEPSWSSDDTQIAFSTNRDGDYDIYTINADGSLPAVLAINAGDETSPSWSSDGNSIAYVKDDDIYTRDSDGTGEETNITNDASTDQGPSW